MIRIPQSYLSMFIALPFLLAGCEALSSLEWLDERHDLGKANCVSRHGESVFVFSMIDGGVSYIHLVKTGEVGSDSLRSVYAVGFEDLSGNPIPISGIPEVLDHATVEIGRWVFSYISTFYPLRSALVQKPLTAVASVSLGSEGSVSPSTSTYESFEFDYVIRCDLLLEQVSPAESGANSTH